MTKCVGNDVYLSINDHPKKVVAKLHKQFGYPTPEKIMYYIIRKIGLEMKVMIMLILKQK